MTHAFDPSATDDDLIRALRRDGSERAFGILYDRHTPRAYQTAWRILGGSQTDVEDAVQEAWVRAIGSLDTRRMDAEVGARSEEHTSELQSRRELVCRLLLEENK